MNTSMYGVVDNMGMPMYPQPLPQAQTQMAGPQTRPSQPQFNLQEAFGQEGSWSGKDYMELFQGIGHLAMAGGKTFQDIYMASKIDPNNLYGNINLQRQDAYANLINTQNQNIDANIRQSGAVPQVYAPRTNPPAQKNNTWAIVAAVVAAVGVVIVMKK